MPEITEQSTVKEVAAIVSDALENAGITAVLSDAQSRDQAILVAAKQNIDWDVLELWFADEGVSDEESRRFREAVIARKHS